MLEQGLEPGVVEEWDAIWLSRGESDYEEVYRAILECHAALRPGQWALEAGSGSGRALCRACEATGARPLALAISTEAIRTSIPMLRQLGGSAVIGDLRQLPFRAGSVPSVFNSGVVEHLRPPQNRDALVEMARVARADGTVVVLVPNRCCPWITWMLDRGGDEDFCITLDAVKTTVGYVQLMLRYWRDRKGHGKARSAR